MTPSLTVPALARGVRRLALAALAALALMALAAVPAGAQLGLTRFDAGFQDAAGNPVTQAGAHADLSIDFGFDTMFDPQAGLVFPTENLKEVQTDLPAGFYGNPRALPTCTVGELASFGVCSPDAQVGIAHLQLYPDPSFAFFYDFRAAVYNMAASDGKAATLAFNAFGLLNFLDMSVRTDGDDGLRATLTNVKSPVPIYATRLVLWGVPADPAHDADRATSMFSYGAPSGAARRPFLTMPARCEPVSFGLRVRGWQDASHPTSATATTPALTGCDKLRFEPKVSAQPARRQADEPAGYDVDVTVPQDDDYTSVGTPQLDKTVVTLPEGVSVSPGSAGGLEACSDAQLGLGTSDPTACPDASKIGTVSIDTPLLPKPLTGEIVLGTPRSGQLFRLFLVARGYGILLKIPGTVQPDPVTGRLTTTFDDAPQLPFDTLSLHFKSGPRAPLTNPRTCGTKTTTATFTSWAGQTTTASDSFDVTGCAAEGFAPTFEAGTTRPLAGGFSPFTMTLRRPDGSADLGGVSLELPGGLLGRIASVPLCGDADAAAGTCADASLVGSVGVEAGSGDSPFPLTGKAYLAGPYKGAPFSLSLVVHALAGPFDLGTVVVRAAIFVDPHTAALRVVSDPLPTILQGIPLRLQTVNVTVDRPGFMFNPTSCARKEIDASISSTDGATVRRSTPFQVGGCAGLSFSPRMTLRVGRRGHTRAGAAVPLSVGIRMPAGGANLKRVTVALPSSLNARLGVVRRACSQASYDAGTCSTRVGSARAVTPVLAHALSGSVYMVKNPARAIPDLVVQLRGQVAVDLVGKVSIGKGGKITARFDTVPDVPISSFGMKLVDGANGPVGAARSLCSKQGRRAKARLGFAAQSGRTVSRGQRLKVVGCGR